MSRCGKTELLEAAVHHEVHDDALREHASQCARCRHELRWLETEQRLFRERAARDEVQMLWRGVEAKVAPKRGINRALVGLAAAVLVVLSAGRLMVGAPLSASGSDAAITPESVEAFMTENAFSAERSELCSKAGGGIGFYCGYAARSVLASR